MVRRRSEEQQQEKEEEEGEEQDEQEEQEDQEDQHEQRQEQHEQEQEQQEQPMKTKARRSIAISAAPCRPSSRASLPGPSDSPRRCTRQATPAPQHVVDDERRALANHGQRARGGGGGGLARHARPAAGARGLGIGERLLPPPKRCMAAVTRTGPKDDCPLVMAARLALLKTSTALLVYFSWPGSSAWPAAARQPSSRAASSARARGRIEKIFWPSDGLPAGRRPGRSSGAPPVPLGPRTRLPAAKVQGHTRSASPGARPPR